MFARPDERKNEPYGHTFQCHRRVTVRISGSQIYSTRKLSRHLTAFRDASPVCRNPPFSLSGDRIQTCPCKRSGGSQKHGTYSVGDTGTDGPLMLPRQKQFFPGCLMRKGSLMCVVASHRPSGYAGGARYFPSLASAISSNITPECLV